MSKLTGVKDFRENLLKEDKRCTQENLDNQKGYFFNEKALSYDKLENLSADQKKILSEGAAVYKLFLL